MSLDPNAVALLGSLATVAVAFPPSLDAVSRMKEFRDRPVARGRLKDAADLTTILATLLLVVVGAITVGGQLGATAFLFMALVVVGVPFLVFALRLPGRNAEDALSARNDERAKQTEELIDLLIAREQSAGTLCQTCGN